MLLLLLAVLLLLLLFLLLLLLLLLLQETCIHSTYLVALKTERCNKIHYRVIPNTQRSVTRVE